MECREVSALGPRVPVPLFGADRFGSKGSPFCAWGASGTTVSLPYPHTPNRQQKGDARLTPPLV